jgi:hypothetical protein
MKLSPIPAPLFTLRDISALLDLPISRIARAVRRGRMIPDFQSRAVKLFQPARLPEIAKLLQG